MLNKAIYYKKEKRKEYRKSKVFDRTCRNHGSCGYCLSNRMYGDVKRKAEINNQLVEWLTIYYYSNEGLLGCVDAYFEV